MSSAACVSSLLSPAPSLLSHAAFSAQPGLTKRRPWQTQSREPAYSFAPDYVSISSNTEPLSLSMTISGPSRLVANHLTWACPRNGPALTDSLQTVIRVLRGALLQLSPEPERNLVLAIAAAHAQVLQVDDELESFAAGTPPAAIGDAAVTRACRRYLQQLQEFLMALQRDVEAGRQARDEEQSPEAEAAWYRILQNANTKLYLANIQPASSEGDAPDQTMMALDSVDNSCSSSVCGSSCNSSKSGHRLVATKSRLRYSSYWAGKVAL